MIIPFTSSEFYIIIDKREAVCLKLIIYAQVFIYKYIKNRFNCVLVEGFLFLLSLEKYFTLREKQFSLSGEKNKAQGK